MIIMLMFVPLQVFLCFIQGGVTSACVCVCACGACVCVCVWCVRVHVCACAYVFVCMYTYARIVHACVYVVNVFSSTFLL